MAANVQNQMLSAARRIVPQRRERGHPEDWPADQPPMPAPEPDDAIGTPGVCRRCGQPARVHVLEGYQGGRPLRHCYCMPCAGVRSSPQTAARPRPLRLGLVLALAGLASAVVGLLGDLLIPEARVGFGWYQRSGVLIGALILFVGLLVRAEVVAVGGALLLGAAAGADWFGLTRGPGMGWKQQALLAAGAGCAGLALAARWAVVYGQRLWRRRWAGDRDAQLGASRVRRLPDTAGPSRPGCTSAEPAVLTE